MTMSSIASKLRALREITVANGATEAEAINAAAAYERLLAKYHMDATELEIREEGTEHVRIEFGRSGNGFIIAQIMGGAIAKFTNCKCWISSQSGAQNYLGLKSDAQFAEWLTRNLVAFAQAEALAFSFETEGVMKSEVETFVQMVGKRISERLKAMTSSPSSTSLVVVRSKMVDEAMSAMGLKFGRARSIAIANNRGASAGYAAGDKAGFARPTSYTKTLAIGGK